MDPVIALKHILVATDFSEASDAALLYGRNFARAHGATLHLLNVVGFAAADLASPVGIPANIGELQRDLEADAARHLEELLSDDDRRDLHARVIVMSAGSAAKAILEYAHTEPIDLIIVGTHGRTGLSHFFMGSVAQQVVRTAPCPVLTVRHPEREFAMPDVRHAASAIA